MRKKPATRHGEPRNTPSLKNTRKGVVPEALHGLQFFADHDDSKILIELYVRPEGAVGGKSPAASSGARKPSAETKSIERFTTAIGALVPELAGVAVFATSAVEDETRLRAPLTAMHSESSNTIGKKSLVYRVVEEDYRVSGGSFFQTNRLLIDELVKVTVGSNDGRVALDLYAGAGLFTRKLARTFHQVIAVEASPHAFDDLRGNVPENVKCISMTTEAFLGQRAAKLSPDLVVVDPPRGGLGERVTRTLCGMSASYVIYVSCDPATLSRDLRLLLESGFRVEQAHLVDMFPQTYHMETVLHLRR